MMGFTSYSFLSKSPFASILGLFPLREPVEALVLTAALHQQSLLHQAGEVVGGSGAEGAEVDAWDS